ncbi:nitroreductase [Gordonia sp. CPCC 205515]|uniref:nitroreductase n=1 Tax=Gordonia sp. CPCC 205515 TaxID=3140791 RepID=UPI003AF38C93
MVAPNETTLSPAVEPAADVLSQLLDERWSCRAFTSDQLPRELVERLLTTAQRSASWCNTQPWQVIVTSGDATDRLRTALGEHVRNHPGQSFDFPAPAQYTGVYRDRRRESGWQLYEAVGVARGDREASARQAFENFRFFGAPHVALITTDAEQGTYGAVDAGLYLATFLLVARSLGIATIPQAALAGQSDFLREYFDIPEDRKVLVGISFGYADEEHPANSYRTRRAALDEVVTWVED